MKDCESNQEIRAVLSGYMALGGIPTVLAITCYTFDIRNSGKGDGIATLLFVSIAGLWALWLRGFKLAVTDKYLVCRDGLYRISRVPLADIV